jgi:hypothetical protein
VLAHGDQPLHYIGADRCRCDAGKRVVAQILMGQRRATGNQDAARSAWF